MTFQSVSEVISNLVDTTSENFQNTNYRDIGAHELRIQHFSVQHRYHAQICAQQNKRGVHTNSASRDDTALTDSIYLFLSFEELAKIRYIFLDLSQLCTKLVPKRFWNLPHQPELCGCQRAQRTQRTQRGDEQTL